MSVARNAARPAPSLARWSSLGLLLAVMFGIAARAELERELGSHVHLELSVRVRRDWRADEGLLDRLGIT